MLPVLALTIGACQRDSERRAAPVDGSVPGSEGAPPADDAAEEGFPAGPPWPGPPWPGPVLDPPWPPGPIGPPLPGAESDEEEARHLYIVAHQDDDLGLMSPDLARDIAAGDAVRTVYLTSGDAGFTCDAYTRGREEGAKAAYALIAGRPNEWDATEQVVRGKVVRLLTLRGTEVSLAFMGLHNSGILEFDVISDLELLWSGGIEAIETRPYDGRSRIDRYTRAELIDTLRQLMVDFAATHINTLDSSKLEPLVWPFDHTDHVHSALFALAALARYMAPHELGMYRAYNAQFEQENVSPTQASAKLAAFQLYTTHDPKICEGETTVICDTEVPCDHPLIYAGYELRQYRVAVFQNIAGFLRTPGAQCLRADVASASVGFADCAPADVAQQWRIPRDGSVRHLASGLCLRAQPAERGSVLGLARCEEDSAQRFWLTEQTQLRGPDGTCVQRKGEQLTLAECELLEEQLGFSPGLFPNVLTGLIERLSDLRIPDWISYYGSLSFGDVDGDGDGDLCVRAFDGVYCSFSQAGAFAPYQHRLSAFTDDAGWLRAARGATVQLADINGDGAADICGRGTDGVYCATWDGEQQAFAQFGRRSAGEDFSDAAGYGAEPSRYRSLRLADVDGDDVADVCARNPDGIACALNAGDGTFLPARQWIQHEFSDATGWNEDSYGTTMRFGDIDGDGLLDVCGRHALGIVCAVNDRAERFRNPHVWSYTGDFTDEGGWNELLSYYGSIRLVDIDSDGKADVCGRGSAGVVCGISTGAAFSIATPLGSAEAFSDRLGWSLSWYGSTFGIIDVDQDDDMDLCARGPDANGRVGIQCALAQ